MRRAHSILPVLAAFILFAAQAAAAPRLMILMDERVMGVFGTTGWEVPTEAELVLMEHFRSQGYEVIDMTTMRRGVTQQQGLRILAGDDRGAAAAGLEHGARWSILGTAISKPAGAKLFGTQMQSIQATLTARVVDNDTARVIATGTATAAKPHIDEVQGGVLAIRDAAKKLAAELSGQMNAALQQTANAPVQVSVSGLVSFRHLEFLMHWLNNELSGARAVNLETFNSGTARISVDHPGGGDAVASQISAARFTGFRIEPHYVTGARVDMNVVLGQ